jgi:hypothetical protein
VEEERLAGLVQEVVTVSTTVVVGVRHARMAAAVLAAQPLAVEKMRASELHPQAGAGKPLDRLFIKTLAVLPAASSALHRALIPSSGRLVAPKTTTASVGDCLDELRRRNRERTDHRAGGASFRSGRVETGAEL